MLTVAASSASLSLIPSASCPVCLDTFDTKLPSVTPECGHRSHTGCLDRWTITCAKPECPVCRVELTGEVIDDEQSNPLVVTDALPLNLYDFATALFQAGRTYDVRRADAVLTTAPLSLAELTVCQSVVDQVLLRARVRMTIMSWREYNQFRNFIDVFMYHEAVDDSWYETVPTFFQTFRALQKEHSGPADCAALMNPAGLKAALLQASVSPPDYIRTIHILNRIGADAVLHKVACEVLDLMLEKRLLCQTDLNDYELFRGLVDIYLCRRIGTEATLGKVVALSVLHNDFVYAQMLKDDFGVSLHGPLLFQKLGHAAEAMNDDTINKLLALSGAGQGQLRNWILQRALMSVNAQPVGSLTLDKLPKVIAVLTRYGAVDPCLVNEAMRMCLLGDNIEAAKVLKFRLRAAVNSEVFMDVLQKATHTRNHKKTDLLLDLTTGEPALRALVGNLLAATLQAIVDQSGQAECSVQPGLCRFVDTVFQHGIIDARLLAQAVNVFQRLEGAALAQRLKSQYSAYLVDHDETVGLLACLSLSEDS